MNITDVDDKIIKRSWEEGKSISEITKKNEKSFFDDMEALAVKRPTVVTRVTDYIKEIIAFTQQIIDNGFGYLSNGSVYFDTKKFEEKGHQYCKLVPQTQDNNNKKESDSSSPLSPLDSMRTGNLSMEDRQKLLDKEEGSLVQDRKGEKRDKRDFVLWKASKPNEPSWDAEFNSIKAEGRPGWHLECSAMQYSIFGSKTDLHCGGVDLKFPHHDNELAQSEAFMDGKNMPEGADPHQVVNYFMHSGFVTINSNKMGKSEGNFMTIKGMLYGSCKDSCKEAARIQAGRTFSPAVMRLFVMSRGYSEDIDVSDDSLKRALQLDKLFREFKYNVKDLRKKKTKSSESITSCYIKFGEEENELNNYLSEMIIKIDNLLRENIQYHVALNVLVDIVHRINKYIGIGEERDINMGLVDRAYDYVVRMLDIFGLEDALISGANIVKNKKDGEDSPNDNDEPEIASEKLESVVAALTDFRKSIRSVCLDKKNSDIQKLKPAVLTECDKFRDEILPKIGVQITDKGQESTWRIRNPHELLAEIEEVKREALRAKQLKEQQKQQQQQQRGRQGAQGGRKKVGPEVPAEEMFMVKEIYPNFVEFDENGIPTKKKEGEGDKEAVVDISKKESDRLRKLYNNQKLAHEKYLKAHCDRD